MSLFGHPTTISARDRSCVERGLFLSTIFLLTFRSLLETRRRAPIWNSWFQE